MKRIVLCFDGTWNKPADDDVPAEDQVETNVRRFYESVESVGADGVKQVPWYNPGVGTEWYDKVVGGAFGALLDRHIIDGYRTLVDLYDDSDEIYIVGFSRGAYTARSLVGMIRNCGLVRPRFAAINVPVAYGIYRTRDEGVDSRIAVEFRKRVGREIKIKFLGIWDTVGALGIPAHFAEQFNSEFYKFHDTRLSSIVENAFHAVALDEHRGDYEVCLWNPGSAPAQTLEQRWFCGAHADVGGGYPSRRLSDLTLRWMQDRASALGLNLAKVAVADDGYLGEITDSYSRFLLGKYSLLKQRHFRRVLMTQFGNEKLAPSLERRRRDGTLVPPYAPTNSGLPPLS